MPLLDICPVYQTDTIVMAGDSISHDYAGLAPFNGFHHAWLEKVIGARRSSRQGTGNLIRAAKGIPRFIDGSVGGQTSAGLLANLAPLVTDNNPDIVVIEIGVNDVFSSVSDAVFAANIHDIVLGIKAWAALQTNKPYGIGAGWECRIVIGSILCFGEKWTDNMVDVEWGHNPLDSDILAKNAILLAEATAEGCTYVDVRSKLLSVLPTYNPANNYTLGFCYDPVTAANGGYGVHPSYPDAPEPPSIHIRDARVLMGQWYAEKMQMKTFHIPFPP